MILLIDNYDSFVYNLYQFVGKMDPDVRVIRNNEMTVEEIRNLNPSRIILSPGPGYPKDAGVCEQVVRVLGKEIPILGVCLGHQGICEAFGAKIAPAKQLMHGKQSVVRVENTTLVFKTLPTEIKVARYHSLAAVKETLPECLKITAKTKEDEIMAVEHKKYPIYGVQFHPESILTPSGKQMIKNFLEEEKENCDD